MAYLRAAWSATASNGSPAVSYAVMGRDAILRAISPADGRTTASGKGLCQICYGERPGSSDGGRLPISSRAVLRDGQVTLRERPKRAIAATKGGGRPCTTRAEIAIWCRMAALRPCFAGAREGAALVSTAACLAVVW